MISAHPLLIILTCASPNSSPPAPHPLVSLVCIQVQFLAQSLSSCPVPVYFGIYFLQLICRPAVSCNEVTFLCSQRDSMGIFSKYFFSYTQEISTSLALIYSKLSSFTSICSLKLFPEGFVYIYTILPKLFTHPSK